MAETVPPPVRLIPPLLAASPERAQVERVDRIGNRLREAFDGAAAEPLPRAFEDLLQQLR